MLWYKAWLESRWRFLIAVAGCVALCVQLVLATPRSHDANETLLLLHGVHQGFSFIWMLAVTLLMMGGLLRENAIGSAAFTLSLPVSRMHLTCVRLAMGLAQGIVLAVTSWAGMLFAAHVAGRMVYISQAGFHIFLLLGGGVVFVALAFLISSLVESAYTAPIVSFGVMIMLLYELSKRRLVPYSPWTFMLGFPYFRHQSPILERPLPLAPAGIFLGVAILLVLVSIKLIDERDF
jgi:ABC-2 type transport system permease protein